MRNAPTKNNQDQLNTPGGSVLMSRPNGRIKGGSVYMSKGGSSSRERQRLNPDEGVWNHLKSTLANGRPDTQEELMDILAKEICRLAASQHLLRACIQQSDLPPFLP